MSKCAIDVRFCFAVPSIVMSMYYRQQGKVKHTHYSRETAMWSPGAVEEVARDLKLSPAMVYRLLALCRKNPSPGCARPWICTGKGIFLQVKE
jgi:hypothetical protein